MSKIPIDEDLVNKTKFKIKKVAIDFFFFSLEFLKAGHIVLGIVKCVFEERCNYNMCILMIYGMK